MMIRAFITSGEVCNCSAAGLQILHDQMQENDCIRCSLPISTSAQRNIDGCTKGRAPGAGTHLVVLSLEDGTVRDAVGRLASDVLSWVLLSVLPLGGILLLLLSLVVLPE